MGWYSDENGVLINLRGIKKTTELRRAEFNASGLRALELKRFPIPGKYDLAHLQKIHQHLFHDLYGWAGEIRSANFYKKDVYGWESDFADFDKIPSIANDVSQFIWVRDKLKNLDKEAFAEAITHVFVQINHMHPFPEGNGRSTRVMLYQFAKEAGYALDIEKISATEWNTASARSMKQTRKDVDAYNQPRLEVRKADTVPIRELFDRMVTPL
jgi:cell filamentation protein